jgi:DNA invertase Pin-like site-specific DNA recombinase
MPRRDIQSLPTAILYTRVSSDDQAREGLSLDTQIAECRRYAASHGWVLGDEFQDVMSGMRDDRPRYQAMLSHIRQMRTQGRPVVVVVAALDRFGRRLLERVRCREELKSLGVTVHSVREGGEVSDLVANILASVAQEEVRRLGERLRAANRHMTRNGWHHVGRPPWGYRWRPSTEHERQVGAPKSALDIDEAAAPFVREAFERLARGDSIRSVANWLARLPEQARAGRKMRYSGVHVILQMRTYVGEFEDGSPGRWPVLVDPEIWHRAQESIIRHKHQPKQASRQYLLTGFLRCDKCGARMSGWHQRGRELRYRCMGNQQGAASPNFRCYHNLRCEAIDAPVLASATDVLKVLAQPGSEEHALLVEGWETQRRQSSDDEFNVMLRKLQLEADKARERLTRAAVLLVDGTLDKAGYERLRDKGQADLEAAEHEILRISNARPIHAELPPLNVLLSHAHQWSRMLTEGNTDVRREVLSNLIRTVTPIRLMRDTYVANIEWSQNGLTLRALSDHRSALSY